MAACTVQAWADRVRRLTPATDLTDQSVCREQATHLATVQHLGHGLVIQVTAMVCTGHAELVRSPRAGWIAFPHAPLPASALES